MNKVDVIGYEGYYEITDCGRIFSKVRKINNQTLKPKEMSLVSNGTGYLQVTLNVNNSRKKFYIHRLIWECFNGPIPDGYEIDHIDCDKSNNKLSNLQLLSRKENMNKCLYHNPHVEDNLIQNQKNGTVAQR